MGESISRGANTEKSFQELMNSRGWKMKKSTQKEDMFEHWDFLMSKGEHSLKVDVKSTKKLNRQDTNTDNSIIWVEMLNVRGNDGWLYGKADYIAFQTDSGYSFIKREDLIGVVKAKVTSKKVADSRDALYNLYTRRGRKDLLTILKYSDIESLCKKI